MKSHPAISASRTDTHRPVWASLALILALLACSLPGTQALSPDDQAATLIAATFQAGNENGADVPITATFSPIPPPVEATATTGPTATITPTYSVPMLTLREQTNCRAGPGQNYDILFAYIKGVKREILGYYAETNYWLVKAPESATGECWLWGEYAELTGSYWVVPSLTPPPTPTLALPKAPAVKYTFNCDYAVNQMTVVFTWTDYAVNEDGYRIIRDEQAVVELPPDTTSYTDIYTFVAGTKVAYQIEVYNVTGFARSGVISVTC